MQLPQTLDPAFFDRNYRLDHTAWRRAVVEVCATHHLECNEVTAYSSGSNLVADVDGRWIVKIFPAFHRHQWESERRVLAHLGGATLPLQIPTLIAEGTRNDAWPYVIMSKLPGLALDACWDQIGLSDRVRILEHIGSTMALVHRLPLGDLGSLPPDWGSFLTEQRVNCQSRHAQLGMPLWFERGLEDLVREWAPEVEAERVLLTGEYTPFNLLVQRGAMGWQLTGMIDFGDAMVGPPDYDLLGPSMFSCVGEPPLVAALLRGYSGAPAPMNRRKRMRLIALAVLHRYANFNVQLRIPGWRERAGSFEDLAELAWPSME